MNILIAAGGTGGHLYPSVALGRELRKRKCDLLYAAGANKLTCTTLQRENFSFTEILSAPMSNQPFVNLLTGVPKILKGVTQALKIIRTFKPDCVIGFGSYVSVPILLAASLKRIPSILHEQNVSPGLANRLCALFSRKVAVSFPQTQKSFPQKGVLVGNPVRGEILRPAHSNPRERLGLKKHLRTLLVFGGSAGARAINRGISISLENLSQHRDKIQFLHLSGNPEETEKLKIRYNEKGFHSVVLDYTEEMGSCYRACDLAVCRAGATSIAELIATKTPAILIPYPYATGSHQKENAQELEKMGCATLLEERGDLGPGLSSRIDKILLTDSKLDEMRKSYEQFPFCPAEASGKFADLVMSVTK